MRMSVCRVAENLRLNERAACSAEDGQSRGAVQFRYVSHTRPGIPFPWFPFISFLPPVRLSQVPYLLATQGRHLILKCA